MATASLKRPDDLLDTNVRLVTPERIVFQYPLAGPFCRAFAYALDLCIVLLLLLLVVIVLGILSLGTLSGLGPIFVAYFLLMWGYRAICEGLLNGQTLGKRMVGLRVVSDRGVPITAAQSVIRNLIGALEGTVPYLSQPALMCMLLMIGLTSMILTRKFQRLGDLAAGTMVVIEERRRRVGLVRVDEPGVAALLPWLPLRVEAGPELARALSDYVQHRGRYPRALREEMADPLARPLRARYGLPADSAADIVLCAVYHRVFVGE